ncbi:unnamed protein product [Rotaria sp. Silwood1]|nr:unnamed protein product [Rotaria sp. Silwood1]CAF4868186.1 unnamed protein product [Rotaria sp. Silwood1]
MTETTASDKNGLTLQIEDFIIVWLDATINPYDNNRLFKRQFLLQISSNCIQTFADQHECIEYIRQNINEHIFLIVSGSLGKNVVPLVHNLSQVIQIYVFCAVKGQYKSWSESFTKIRGFFIDENRLMACLKNDLKMYSNTLVPISIGYTNERSLQDIDKEQVNFLWFQLLIEVIYRLPQTPIAKK